MNRFVRQSALKLSGRFLDGVNIYSAGIDKLTRSENSRFYMLAKTMFRRDSSDLNYLLYPDEWGMAYDNKEIKYNNTLTLGLEHHYYYNKGTGNIHLRLRSSTLGSDYDYSQAIMETVNKSRLGRFQLNTRLYLQYSSGSKQAKESSLYLAGANPEEMMENKYMRSIPFYDNRYQGFDITTTNVHYGGGLNLRGYAGYLVPQEDENGNLRFVYKGRTGAAVNAELEFDRLFRFRPSFTRRWLRLHTYLFGDAGVINYNNISEDFVVSDIRADAGIGAALTIHKWGALEMADPLTVRFDFPLFLNRTPAVEPDFIQFRWIVGVSRAF